MINLISIYEYKIGKSKTGLDEHLFIIIGANVRLKLAETNNFEKEILLKTDEG